MSSQSVSRAKHTSFFPPSIILSSSTERESESKDNKIEDRRNIVLVTVVRQSIHVIIVYHVRELSKEPAVEKTYWGERS
jgi:hypothetical protein